MSWLVSCSCSVNIGRHNSIMTRVHQVNPSVYFMGCPCHISHNTAAEAFCKLTGFDVEELAVDIFYWFDKAQRGRVVSKNTAVFVTLDTSRCSSMSQHGGLVWKWPLSGYLSYIQDLKSYFLSESCDQARFKRLQSLLRNLLTEIYLLFYQSVLPVFNHFNLFLQREDTCIHWCMITVIAF